jgi:hypothetical protein
MKFKLDESFGARAAGFRFPPRIAPGIAVLRLPRVASPSLLTGLVRNLLAALQTASIAGRLWVVEAGRIRVYEETGDDAAGQ